MYLLSQVVSWLKSSGLAEHADLFHKNGLKGADLTDLTHADLSSMGLDRCTDRKAILRFAVFLYSYWLNPLLGNVYFLIYTFMM
jgi:hypothetical protein